MGTARRNIAMSGTSASAIAIGGRASTDGPGTGNLTEEWTADLANKTITSS